LLAFAVGVGHQQLVVAAFLLDVGDAGGEGAADAGQLEVDVVGDQVRRQARELRRDGLVQVGDLGLLDGVEQLVAHVVAAVGQRVDGADDERVGALGLPGAVVDVVDVADDAGVDDLEGAAALEVGLDDGGDLLRGDAFVGEAGHGDRDLVAADAGNFDAHLRLGRAHGGGDRQAGVKEGQFFHINAYPSC